MLKYLEMSKICFTFEENNDMFNIFKMALIRMGAYKKGLDYWKDHKPRLKPQPEYKLPQLTKS